MFFENTMLGIENEKLKAKNHHLMNIILKENFVHAFGSKDEVKRLQLEVNDLKDNLPRFPCGSEKLNLLLKYHRNPREKTRLGFNEDVKGKQKQTP